MRSAETAPSRAEALDIRVLGPLEVTRGGQQVRVGSGRERAVLTLLALRAGRPVSTHEIGAALWGDSPPASAAKALQTFVSHLRRRLPEGTIRTVPGGYLMDIDPEAVDALRFERRAAGGQELLEDGAPIAAVAELREATAEWRGEPIADLARQPPGQVERVRLLEILRGAEDDLAEARLVLGEHAGLVPELERAVAAEPLRERRWAQLMRALYHGGRQGEALEAYGRLRERLADELGIEPSLELRLLERAILRQEVEPASATTPPQWPVHPAARATPVGDGTPFVGREAERAELRTLMQRALAGTGALVMIGGEPGVGKTRLAEEVMAEAERRGLQVYAGHSYEMEGAAPYVAVVEIMETALARAPSPQAWRRFLGDEAPEVAKLVPKLRRLCPDIPAALDLPAEQERRLLFNSVRDVIERTARRRALLLVLDDLHWADAPTLLFLEHLGEHIAELPVLVVCTYRDTEVDAGRPLAKTFEDLRRRRLARWIQLRRLPEGEVAHMLAALAGQEPPGTLVTAVYTETEGNPFFIEELYKHLEEEARLFDASGRFRADLTVDELDVPAGVRLVVARRLRRLGPGTVPVLVAAAVLGRAFSVELLEALGDADLDTLLDAIDDARRASLIVPAPDTSGEDRYIFAHELIRQSLLTDLSRTRRRHLHLRAANALEHQYAASLDQQAAAIAHHLLEAGNAVDSERAFVYLMRAGRFAMASAAFEEALRHFERAAQLDVVAPPPQRAALFFALGSAHSRLGQLDAALAAWQRSLVEYEELGDADALGRACWEIALSLTWAQRIPESMAMCQRGLAALGGRVSADRARLLARLGAIANVGVDPVTGDAMLSEALQLADELSDDSLRGSILGDMASGRYISMRPTEAVATGLKAVELMRASGDLWGVATALGFVEYSLVHCGRFSAAAEVAEELVPLSERIGNYQAQYLHLRAKGSLEFWRDGDLTAMEAFGQWDLQFAGRHFPGFVGHCYSWLGLAAFLRGDWESASVWLQRGSLNPPAIIPGFCWGSWFQYLAFAGRGDEALAYVEENRGLLPTAGQPNQWTAWTLLMAFTEGLFILGERAEPAGWYPLVLEARSTGTIATDNWQGRLLERIAGIAATAAGDWAAAEAHFLMAQRQADELPHQLERLETRRFYAQMLAEKDGPGDKNRARQLLTDAISGYARLRMPRHEAMAREQLVQIDARRVRG